MSSAEALAQFEKFAGFYSLDGFTRIEVKVKQGQLVGQMVGTPPGFEIVFLPESENHFRMKGGPLEGGQAEFKLDENGTVIALKLGPVEINRDPSAELPSNIIAYGFNAAPLLELTPAKAQAFEAVYQAALAKGEGSQFEYTLAYPKHEFLRYLRTKHPVVFHGSNNQDIAVFSPVRQSHEMFDSTDRGNLQGVYATHIPLWSMFFAILDRKRATGSMRSVALEFKSQAGETEIFYEFSINREALDKQPWLDGTIYILPEAAFTRLRVPSGELLAEWVSPEPVRPLAKLAVSPTDFPFLDKVGGHDDSTILHFSQLRKEIFRQVQQVAELEDGLALRLDWNETLAAQLLEFIALLRKVIPTMSVELVFEAGGGPIWLRSHGPELLKQLWKKELSQY